MRIDQKFSLTVSWILYQVEYIRTYHSEELEKVTNLFEKTTDIKGYLAEIEKINSVNLPYNL